MKKLISSFIVVLLALFMFSACDKEVDLITNNQVAKIESFQLYDQQNLTVLASTAMDSLWKFQRCLIDGD